MQSVFLFPSVFYTTTRKLLVPWAFIEALPWSRFRWWYYTEPQEPSPGRPTLKPWAAVVRCGVVP